MAGDINNDEGKYQAQGDSCRHYRRSLQPAHEPPEYRHCQQDPRNQVRSEHPDGLVNVDSLVVNLLDTQTRLLQRALNLLNCRLKIAHQLQHINTGFAVGIDGDGTFTLVDNETAALNRLQFNAGYIT